MVPAEIKRKNQNKIKDRKGYKMAENIITIVLLVLCAIRTISYGIFEIKKKNIVGGIGVFFLPFAAAACLVAVIAK